MAAKKKTNTLKQRMLAAITKKFGEGLASFADDDDGNLDRLALGIAPLDYITLGGLPLGKVTLLRGPESGSKTTLAVLACARYLERFKTDLVAYIDAEEKYPAQFVKRLKMDGSRLLTVWPETAESTIDFVEYALREKNIGLLVIDSLAAIVPKIEIEASAEDQQQGVAARMINKMVRKIVAALKSARVERERVPTVILINQERIKIGVRYGDPMTLPGGMGQNFAASLTLRLRPMTMRKEDTEGFPEDAPIVKIGATIFKHSFGPKGKGAEYLLAMDNMQTLKAGEANDADFVRIMARKLGYISQNGRGFSALDREGISAQQLTTEMEQRGKLYRDLKRVVTAAAGRPFIA